MNLDDIDDLCYNSPSLVPTSEWRPSSYVESDAKMIAEREEEIVGVERGKGDYAAESGHLEDVY